MRVKKSRILLLFFNMLIDNNLQTNRRFRAFFGTPTKKAQELRDILRLTAYGTNYFFFCPGICTDR